MCRFINNVNKTIDENNISIICRNISHKIVTIGFLSGYSTTHQLIELNDDILLALDKKQITSITFADISKAFDTVWIHMANTCAISK
jgi:sensor c-di-GMP phosphodiesterase-like protein